MKAITTFTSLDLPIESERKRSAPPSPFQPPVIDPEFALGGNPPSAFRLLHRGCPRELAHQRVNELGSMTLTIGSILREPSTNAAATLLGLA